MSTYTSRPLRVMHLIHNLKREGAQMVLNHLVSAQHQSLIKPLICSWRQGGDLEETLKSQGIDVFIAEKKYASWELIKWIKELAAKHQVDLIHAHMPDSALIASLLRLFYGLPFIITHHSTSLVTPMRWKRHYLRLAGLATVARLANRHVAISPQVEEKLIRLGIPKNKTMVIYNGVAIPQYSLRTPEPLSTYKKNNPCMGPIFVTVGRLVQLKGFDQILNAFTIVKNQLPQAHLFLLGEGGERKALQKLCHQLKLNDSVTFLGLRQDVAHWLSHADVLINCSQWEGVPLSILEAMAWMVPVVASNVPGNQDVIKDQVTGRLYPWGQTDQLARTLLELLNQPAQTKQLSHNAYQQIEKIYSQDAMTQAYSDLYYSITGKNASLEYQQ